MGTWGTAIFSDDLTCDIRDTFREHILNGLNPDEATRLIIQAHQETIRDPDEGPTFWIGLALTQWKLGRLLPEIKDKALVILEKGGDLARWEDSKADVLKRRKVLVKLKAQLLSPRPMAKKLKAPFQNTTHWEIGSIVAYQMLDGQYCLMRIIAHETSSIGVTPVIDLLKWRGTKIPQMDLINRLVPIRGKMKDWEIRPVVMVTNAAKHVPLDRCFVVGIQKKPLPWQKQWYMEKANAYSHWSNWDQHCKGLLKFALGE